VDISVVTLYYHVDHLHEMEVDEYLIRQTEANTDDILSDLPKIIERMIERQRNSRIRSPVRLTLNRAHCPRTPTSLQPSRGRWRGPFAG